MLYLNVSQTSLNYLLLLLAIIPDFTIAISFLKKTSVLSLVTPKGEKEIGRRVSCKGGWYNLPPGVRSWRSQLFQISLNNKHGVMRPTSSVCFAIAMLYYVEIQAQCWHSIGLTIILWLFLLYKIPFLHIMNLWLKLKYRI